MLFSKKPGFAGSVVLFLLVDQVAIMNRIGKPAAIMRRIQNDYGAWILDHELTAEDAAFSELLGGIAAERERGRAAAQHQQANKILHEHIPSA